MGLIFLDNSGIIIEIFLGYDPEKGNKETDIRKKDVPMCLAAANRIISRTNAQNRWRSEHGRPRIALTGKRLQKILYLCQLFWYIDHDESKMITEDFQAWPNGPVIPEIYDYFSIYQDGDMCPLRNVKTSSLSDDERTLINRIVDSTIDTPTETIIDFTHTKGSPWDLVYRDGQGAYGVISKESLKQYIGDPKHRKELITFIRDGQPYGGN